MAIILLDDQVFDLLQVEFYFLLIGLVLRRNLPTLNSRTLMREIKNTDSRMTVRELATT